MTKRYKSVREMIADMNLDQDFKEAVMSVCEVCGEESAVSTCVGCTQKIGPSCQSEDGKVCNECVKRCKRDMDDSIERLIDRRVAAAFRRIADRYSHYLGNGPMVNLMSDLADELDTPKPVEPERYIPFEDEVLFLGGSAGGDNVAVNLCRMNNFDYYAWCSPSWDTSGYDVFNISDHPVCEVAQLRKRETQS